jgi:hypothetical protein
MAQSRLVGGACDRPVPFPGSRGEPVVSKLDLRCVRVHRDRVLPSRGRALSQSGEQGYLACHNEDHRARKDAR